jgi:hypothetical protein
MPSLEEATILETLDDTTIAADDLVWVYDASTRQPKAILVSDLTTTVITLNV